VSTSHALIRNVRRLFSQDLSVRRASVIKLRQNQLTFSNQIFFGDLGSTREYFDVQEVERIDANLLEGSAQISVIIEMADESVLTTVKPAYSILGVIEGLGGFAIVLIFISKFLVNGMHDRLLLTELIESFYQVRSLHGESTRQLDIENDSVNRSEKVRSMIEDKGITKE